MIVMQRITQITSTLNIVNVQLLQTSAANIQYINTLKYVALDERSRQLVDLMQRHTGPSTCSRWNAKSSQISSDVNATIKAKICVFGFIPLPVPGTQEVSISCASHMAGAESESIMGIWEWSPQWGQHAEPLVSGSGGRSPTEAENYLPVGSLNEATNLLPSQVFSNFQSIQ